MEWLKNHYEKIILWVILGCWVGLGWQFYSTWVSKMNPSEIDRILRPSKNWDPSLVNKDLKVGDFEKMMVEKPLVFYKEIYDRNPFFPLPAFTPPPPESPKGDTKPRPTQVTMNLVCQGVMQVREQGRIIFEAMLKNEKSGATYFVREGMEVEGWKVEKITPSGVILYRPGKPKYELKVGG